MIRVTVVSFVLNKPQVTMKSDVAWETGVLITDDNKVEVIVSKHGAIAVNKVWDYHKRSEEGSFWVQD
jgi:hypothetical protein